MMNLSCLDETRSDRIVAKSTEFSADIGD